MTVTLRQRSGLYTLRKAAYATCQAVVKFGPYLKLYFSNRPTLVAAIDAVSAACSVLINEIDEAKAAIYPP